MILSKAVVASSSSQLFGLLLAASCMLSIASAQDGVAAHNSYRARHRDTPALSYSSDLAAKAQACSDRNAARGGLGQDCPEQVGFGSNQASQGGHSSATAAITAAIGLWYAEIGSYRYDNPVFSRLTGHFTQLVWANSKQVGCAARQGGSQWYSTCLYSPAGNFRGQFTDNVKPLR